jgi:hypothetical protein
MLTEVCQVSAGMLFRHCRRLQKLLLQEIEGYELFHINNADERGLFFSLQPSKTLTFQGDFSMVVQNQNNGLLCSLRAMKVVVINYYCSNWKI